MPIPFRYNAQQSDDLGVFAFHQIQASKAEDFGLDPGHDGGRLGWHLRALPPSACFALSQWRVSELVWASVIDPEPSTHLILVEL